MGMEGEERDRRPIGEMSEIDVGSRWKDARLYSKEGRKERIESENGEKGDKLRREARKRGRR